MKSLSTIRTLLNEYSAMIVESYKDSKVRPTPTHPSKSKNWTQDDRLRDNYILWLIQKAQRIVQNLDKPSAHTDKLEDFRNLYHTLGMIQGILVITGDLTTLELEEDSP